MHCKHKKKRTPQNAKCVCNISLQNLRNGFADRSPKLTPKKENPQGQIDVQIPQETIDVNFENCNFFKDQVWDVVKWHFLIEASSDQSKQSTQKELNADHKLCNCPSAPMLLSMSQEGQWQHFHHPIPAWRKNLGRKKVFWREKGICIRSRNRSESLNFNLSFCT